MGKIMREICGKDGQFDCAEKCEKCEPHHSPTVIRRQPWHHSRIVVDRGVNDTVPEREWQGKGEWLAGPCGVQTTESQKAKSEAQSQAQSYEPENGPDPALPPQEKNPLCYAHTHSATVPLGIPDEIWEGHWDKIVKNRSTRSQLLFYFKFVVMSYTSNLKQPSLQVEFRVER